MTLEILPQKLFTMHNVKPLLQQKNAAIFHKTLHTDLLDKEIYLAQSALLFLTKGSQIISQYGDQNSTISQGQILFLPKDIYLVSDYTAHNNQFEAILFFITDEIIDRLRPAKVSLDVTKNNSAQTFTPSKQIIKYMTSLVETYADAPNIETLLELKLQELITLISQTKTGLQFLSKFFNSTQSRKRDITQFMKDNCYKNLKVDDYAALTGYSKSTFTRKFKKLYGTSPLQWLIEQRLIKAHKILKQGKHNVTQTALIVGYDNASHFAQAYKNKYNHSPNQTIA